MHWMFRFVLLSIACLALLFCTSCVTLTAQKEATVENPTPTSPTSPTKAAKPLVDTWELLYQIDDKGHETKPKENTRTLIEFTEAGRVYFNELDKETSKSVKNRSGRYALEKDEMTITDDWGYTATWPYKLAGDTLVIVMPASKKKFYWRRSR